MVASERDDRCRPDEALVRTGAPRRAMPVADDSVEIEAEKPDLACETGGAASQRAIDENSGADAGADREQHEVLAVLRDAVGVLSDRRHVDVVFEHDGCNQRLPYGGDHLRALPPGELRSERQVVRAGSQHTGSPHDHLVDAVERDARLPGETFGRTPELRDDGLGSGARRSRRATADHRPGEIDQRCAYPFATDVEAQDPPGSRIDVVELCAGARKAASPADPEQQSEVDELPEHLGDRRLGEPCAPYQCGAATGPPACTNSKVVRRLIARSRLGFAGSGAGISCRPATQTPSASRR